MKAATPAALKTLLADPHDPGLPKLALIHRCLMLRREHPEWFNESAGYTPLFAQGAKATHLVAYLRGDAVLAVAPRLPLGVRDGWQDTAIALPEGQWTNWLTGARIDGGTVALEGLLAEFPVALLIRDAATGRDEGKGRDDRKSPSNDNSRNAENSRDADNSRDAKNSREEK